VEIKALRSASNAPTVSYRKWLNVDLRQFALHLRISKLYVQNFCRENCSSNEGFRFYSQTCDVCAGVQCCHMLCELDIMKVTLQSLDMYAFWDRISHPLHLFLRGNLVFSYASSSGTHPSHLIRPHHCPSVLPGQGS
jgi:hypothetical protein